METHVGVLPVKEEAFWASIVAKWSDACSNIVLLKTELEKAHSESHQHQECINALRAREELLVDERDRLAREIEKYRELASAPMGAEEGIHHSEIQYVATPTVSSQFHDQTTKLRKAEEGLVRVKEEYLRMKVQLSRSDEQLQRKNEEVQRKDTETVNLTLLKYKLQEANLTLTKEKESLEIEFSLNKAIWEKQIADLSSSLGNYQEGQSFLLAQNSELNVEFILHDDYDSVDLTLEQKLTALSQEVESLKASAATGVQENAALHEELSSTLQQLQTANEMNKLLLDKNKALSEDLARVNESLKLRDLALTTPTVSRRDLTLTSTPTEQKHASTGPNRSCTTVKQTQPRLSLCSPPSRTERSSTMRKTISSEPVLQFVSACSSPISMPKARKRLLTQLAECIPDIDCSDVRFRRTLLASAIGGGIQSLIVRVTQSQTVLAKTHGISMYLCPALELNPWCPTIPGEHGYMFVGLGQEKTTFEQPHVGLNVFLGQARSHGKHKEYCYLGVYTAVRVNGLSADEWNPLSDEFKIAYSNATKEKNKDPRTVEAIRAAYDAGELSVPCVRLQCTHFNDGLYNALLAAHLVPSPPRSLRNVEKRRRDNEDHRARPRRLAPHESDVMVEDNELC